MADTSIPTVPIATAPVTPPPVATDPAAAPPTAPINRSIADPNVTAASTYLNTFNAPQSADDIAEGMRKSSQDVIDSINGQADQAVAAAQKTGQQKMSVDDAQAVLSGLMGSTTAANARKADLDATGADVAKVNAGRALDLANTYSKIRQDAQTEADAQKTDATNSATAIMARQDKVKSDAIADVKQLASGGLVDFDQFKNNPANADVYNHALDAYGGSEDALRAAFLVNRPQDQVVGTPTRVGNNFIQAYKNPITGKVSMENIALPADLPPNYTNFQKLGDNLVAIPDGWNGDTSQLKTIAGPPDTMQALQEQSLRLDIQKKQNDLAGGGANADTVPVVNNGKTANVPVDVAPYYNTSHSGVGYADLSTVQGTASEKKAVVDAAQKAGIKVITNKNTALDLANIQDANSKLDSISSIMAGIDQPNVLSRDLAGFGLTKLATMAQSNPQQAASGALQGVGLDILKAISGVQGFRGNSEVVKQITDHLPSIYDTNDVVQQKVAYIRELITDRENSILGTSSNAASGFGGIAVTDPTGGVHTFPDQKSADAFKKAAGIQ
jgi:hypothetical protein